MAKGSHKRRGYPITLGRLKGVGKLTLRLPDATNCQEVHRLRCSCTCPLSPVLVPRYWPSMLMPSGLTRSTA